MLMMRIRGMRMSMRPRVVPVRMTVLAVERRIVRVVVMSVVMTMSVLVFHRLVGVRVAMLFGQVQVNTNSEENRCRQQGHQGRPIAHRPRRSSPSKRGNGKDGSRAARTNLSLGQQIET